MRKFVSESLPVVSELLLQSNPVLCDCARCLKYAAMAAKAPLLEHPRAQSRRRCGPAAEAPLHDASTIR